LKTSLGQPKIAPSSPEDPEEDPLSSAEPTENYLKQLYELSLDQSPVKTSRLAAHLEISPAAVTEMIKRLAGQRLVDYQPYRGAALTRKGKREALKVIRRHRLWETFLFRVLDIPWAQIHDHACRLEHGTNEQLADALAAHLGDPHMDPHGDPIPDHAGNIEERDRLRLDSLEAGQLATVSQCSNEDPRLLAYLKQLQLVPGAQVQVVEVAPFDGPITLMVEGERQIIGQEAARTLIVQHG